MKQLSENRLETLRWTVRELGDVLRTAWVAFTLNVPPDQAVASATQARLDRLTLLEDAQIRNFASVTTLANDVVRLETKVESVLDAVSKLLAQPSR